MGFSAKGLEVVILQTLLYVSDKVVLGPTAQAFISQLRLISAYAEMTPHLTIRAFLIDGLSRASMLPGVGAEIKAFNKAERELLNQHGNGMFPFIKCLRLSSYERLAPVKYPNLCKVTNTRKRNIGTFKDYKTTKESMSRLSDREVETALAQPPVKRKALSKEDAEG